MSKMIIKNKTSVSDFHALRLVSMVVDQGSGDSTCYCYCSITPDGNQVIYSNLSKKHTNIFTIEDNTK